MGAINETATGAAGATVTLISAIETGNACTIYALIAATQTFEICVEISADAGATWVKAKRLTSVVGADATYGQVAELSQYAPRFFRLTLKNTGGAAATIVSDIRLFQPNSV